MPRLRTCILVLAVALAGTGIAAAHPVPVDLCGEIVRGVECALFEADSGAQYVLDDPGTFTIGDRVRVIGEHDHACVSTCQQDGGCIAVSNITYCDGEITACGELVDGVTCTLFEDENGFLFAIENRSGFVVGDRVRLRGTFVRDCVTTCQQTAGCIEDNTIELAPTDGACDESDGGDGGAPIGCSTTGMGLIGLSLIGLCLSRRSVPRG